LIGRK